jgi:uncharacterized protein (DUF305 family)
MIQSLDTPKNDAPQRILYAPKGGKMKKLLVLLAVPFLGFGCSPGPGSDTHSAANPDTTSQKQADHDAMNHTGMDHVNMKSAPNAASAPYDLQFLDTMMAHHQGAIEMAKMIDGKTKNAELKKFGAQIIADQEKEIAQMKAWREKWYAGKPSALNMEMPGMTDSMKMDMAQLTAVKDREFDLAFVEMMIPHHEGAIEMSKDALKKSQHPEIKTLSNQVIKAQQGEIEMMQRWKTAWAK